MFLVFILIGVGIIKFCFWFDANTFLAGKNCFVLKACLVVGFNQLKFCLQGTKLLGLKVIKQFSYLKLFIGLDTNWLDFLLMISSWN